MAGLLKTLRNAANPRKRPEVTLGSLECLDEKTALILFAAAEAVLGAGFLAKAPKFIETIDDYLHYQRAAQRDQFLLALVLVEIRLAGLFSGAPPQPFSHLSLADRRKVLERLRGSSQQQGRNVYAALVNVSASTFYASDLTWPGLGYPGVSVDHPEILDHPQPSPAKPVPWRPDDLRPVEP